MVYRIASFVKDLYKNRRLLWSLAKNDIKEKYMGSYLGMLWAFIQPLFTICIMWFVFSFGFRAVPIDKVPFILWLTAGMVPWLFLSEGIVTAANSIIEKSYLVKKVVFRVSLLPFIKILSAGFIHAFFIVFLVFMFIVHGYYPDKFYIQILYYFFASFALVLSFSYITSSVVVFAKDFGQIIGVAIQFLFWGTPIFWNLDLVPVQWQWVFRLNPCWYIVNGYRDTLIYKKWFWENMDQCVCFWGIVVLVGFIGVILFKKLKPHFADVL